MNITRLACWSASIDTEKFQNTSENTQHTFKFFMKSIRQHIEAESKTVISGRPLSRRDSARPMRTFKRRVKPRSSTPRTEDSTQV